MKTRRCDVPIVGLPRMPHPGPFPSRKARVANGFTLIELLVVVAIIALLVAILVPSLANVRLLAKSAACAANLHALGAAAATYDSDFDGYVPMSWANCEPSLPNPWPSWRSNLLPYTVGYSAFNCPGAEDNGQLGEVFHSSEEVRGQSNEGTVNAGSYGVMYQFSLPSYTAVNAYGTIKEGHPMWSLAFPTAPGEAWTDPSNSVYAADACLAKGPITYPSRSHNGLGTSAIVPPTEPSYLNGLVSRRFGDRHLGTNCLFLGGHVLHYKTQVLEAMQVGKGDCVWDVE